MAKPNLITTIKSAEASILKLIDYQLQTTTLEPKHQYIISEMIMLRLFSIFEDTTAEIAYKIATGANYINGKRPALAIQARSIDNARHLFLTHGRAKPLTNLKWTKSKFIRESVKNVISPNDPFIKSIQNHGGIIEEMRKVRNTLAHNTPSSKADFKTVIRTTYGANLKITPGIFLSSKKRTPICNLVRYLHSTKIILNDMVSGQ